MKQCPQEMLNGITTRSPGLMCVTSAPTSSTMPIGSWPRMSPASRNAPEHLVQVQVRAADAGRRDPDDRVGRLLDGRVGDGVDADVVRAVPGQCLHCSRRYPRWVGLTDEPESGGHRSDGKRRHQRLEGAGRGRARGGDRRDRPPDPELVAAARCAGRAPTSRRDDLSASFAGAARRHPPGVADPAQPRRGRARARQRPRLAAGVRRRRSPRASRCSCTPPRSGSTRRGRRTVPSTSPGRTTASIRSSTRATRRRASTRWTSSRGADRGSCGCGPASIFKREAGPEIRRLFGGPFVPTALLRPGRIPVLPLPDRLVVQAVHARDVGGRVPAGRARAAGRAAPTTSPPTRCSRLTGSRRCSARAACRCPSARCARSPTWRGRRTCSPSPAGWVDMGLAVPVMDTTRAREQLGWTPTMDSESALLELLDGMRETCGARHAAAPAPRRRPVPRPRVPHRRRPPPYIKRGLSLFRFPRRREGPRMATTTERPLAVVTGASSGIG